jgi:hypothetical protein
LNPIHPNEETDMSKVKRTQPLRDWLIGNIEIFGLAYFPFVIGVSFVFAAKQFNIEIFVMSALLTISTLGLIGREYWTRR